MYQCLKSLKLIYVWFDHTWPFRWPVWPVGLMLDTRKSNNFCSFDASRPWCFYAGYGLAVSYRSAIYRLAMGQLWVGSTGYWLAINYLLATYWLSISWLLAGYQMAIGWLSAGYQLAIGWLLAGYKLAIIYHLADHGLAMGCLSAIHQLATSQN